MEKVTNKIINLWEQSSFRTTVIASLVTGMIAHGFIYANAIYGLDAIYITSDVGWLNLGGTKWLSGPGFAITLFQNLPWLSGMLGQLLMIGVIWMLVNMFSLRHWAGIWLMAGLAQTNPALIGANTYGNIYIYYLALFFAVGAVYSVYKDTKFQCSHCLACIILIMCSVALYGAYVQVTVSLMLVLLILNILQQERAATFFKRGVREVLCLIIGLIMFYTVLKILLSISGQQLNSYLNEDSITSVQTMDFSGMLYRFFHSYQASLNYYFWYPFGIHWLNGIILGLAVLLTLFQFFRNSIDRKLNFILLCICGILIFPAMDIIQIISNSWHYLMFYSFSVPFFYTVGIVNQSLEGKHVVKAIQRAIIALLSLMVYYGFVLSNTVYIRWNNYYIETLNMCSRLLSHIEQCDDFDGGEDIAIVWDTESDAYFNRTGITPIPMLDMLWNVEDDRLNGLYQISIPEFMNRILGSPLHFEMYSSVKDLENNISLSANDLKLLSEMESYPDSSSIQEIDGQIVVILAK